jgi:Protein of unknown function (DUF2510)
MIDRRHNSDMSLPPAGWFTDPENPLVQRWWDGAAWSDFRQPFPQPAPPPAHIEQAVAAPVANPAPEAFASSSRTEYRQGQRTVKPKSPALALIVSFFITGAGLILIGEVAKGVIFLIGQILSIGLLTYVINSGQAQFTWPALFGIVGFWIAGMVEAYKGAQRWNAEHGIVS